MKILVLQLHSNNYSVLPSTNLKVMKPRPHSLYFVDISLLRNLELGSVCLFTLSNGHKTRLFVNFKKFTRRTSP